MKEFNTIENNYTIKFPVYKIVKHNGVTLLDVYVYVYVATNSKIEFK